MGSVSHRYSIRWLPHETTEPTSTLVLTSKSGYYTDIRIRHNRADSAPPCLSVAEDALLQPSSKPITQEGSSFDSDGTAAGSSAILPEARLDWAFAGPSSSTTSTPRKSTWDHWVDSKTNLITDKPIQDSGFMYPQDDGKTLEKGSMPNPSTGQETEYEEVWEDITLSYPGNLDYEYYILTHDVSTNDRSERARGVAMQLGVWYQAIYRRDATGDADQFTSDFHAARWKWDEDGGKWDLVAQVGGDKTPHPSTVESMMKESGTQAGSSIRLGDQDWVCKELSNRS